MFWVCFPNESTYQEINIDLDKFERRNEFEDEVFGCMMELIFQLKNEAVIFLQW